MRVLVNVSVSFLLTFCERWHKYLRRNENNNILKEAEEKKATKHARYDFDKNLNIIYSIQEVTSNETSEKRYMNSERRREKL